MTAQKIPCHESLLFGENVRTYRDILGWSMRNLSEQSGVALSHLSAIENGHKDVTITTASKIARSFGVTLASMMEV